MIALLLRAFRDLWSLPRCWKPIVHQVFSQGMVGKRLFACGALNSSSPIACGGPGRAIFPAEFSQRGFSGADKQSAERASSSSSSDGSIGASAVVRPHPPRALGRGVASTGGRRRSPGAEWGGYRVLCSTLTGTCSAPSAVASMATAAGTAIEVADGVTICVRVRAASGTNEQC